MDFGEEVYKRMIDCGMDTESLFLIKEDNINELFPVSMLGTRMKFKQRLANLKENKENIIRSPFFSKETLLIISKFLQCL
ncbi:uncharacterized protein [Eurosta solidaginis]